MKTLRARVSSARSPRRAARGRPRLRNWILQQRSSWWRQGLSQRSPEQSDPPPNPTTVTVTAVLEHALRWPQQRNYKFRKSLKIFRLMEGGGTTASILIVASTLPSLRPKKCAPSSFLFKDGALSPHQRRKISLCLQLLAPSLQISSVFYINADVCGVFFLYSNLLVFESVHELCNPSASL